MTWPRTLEQEPINIGDRNYHPLFPYGWGLRTRSARPRLAGRWRGARTSGGMGRAPIGHPPRHLAIAGRSRTDAREHVVAEWVLAAVAMVLTAAVVISSMFNRPDPTDPADRAPDPAPEAAAPPPARPASPAPTPPAAAARPTGWRPIGGTRVEPVAAAPDPAAGFTGHGRADQGMARPAVRRCAQGRTYAATVRLRASRPGTLVQVSLLELAGGRRLAADTVGAVLADRGWQRVEVAHQAHRPGSALALAVVLPRGSPPATVLVGDLQMATGSGHRLGMG
jgi:hypothetical protein